MLSQRARARPGVSSKNCQIKCTVTIGNISISISCGHFGPSKKVKSVPLLATGLRVVFGHLITLVDKRNFGTIYTYGDCFSQKGLFNN